MWSHYTKNHHGICLEFAVEENTMFGRGGKVEYFPKLPAFPVHKAGIDNMTDTTFLSKASCWEYEIFVRNTRRLATHPPNRILIACCSILLNR
jgi:hypothetical protein